MQSKSYDVVAPDSADNKALYIRLAQEYWTWIQGKNPDSDATDPNDPDVTFLRDDIIGPQIYHEVGIGKGNLQREGPPLQKKITVKAGSKIFFPIYHVLC